ncbi:MarR family winged helix-turn-helix transcriptional regulator [Pseudorhodobacter sp.]|uniref:MarR family winged helix-turn-helix transcriptional regulator n=1 Tax=Pseudorhodobacter sp. TaxID=1934400 RepID=UPI00264A21A7|nr:MarR family winged helix-turn-helix transcriptional regulator [Pseudorhodobacter sp.]MDN5786081.1 MarR family winged helix-turn-helix transcriptional regulator [Pseudorhodobacter sp.]
MNDQGNIPTAAAQQLAEMGLEGFPPYLMNRIMGRYNAAVRQEMAVQGLTTPQMRSLAVLSVIDGILIRELAVYTVVPQSTLSRALDPLARDGLIRRVTDAEDSRATRVFLTDTGRAAYNRLWPHLTRANEAMFAGISDTEKRALIGTLKTMLRNIRKHDF